MATASKGVKIRIYHRRPTFSILANAICWSGPATGSPEASLADRLRDTEPAIPALVRSYLAAFGEVRSSPTITLKIEGGMTTIEAVLRPQVKDFPVVTRGEEKVLITVHLDLLGTMTLYLEGLSETLRDLMQRTDPGQVWAATSTGDCGAIDNTVSTAAADHLEWERRQRSG